ncbi:hypothetical protein C0Z16_22315 [Paraburkholderia rhynchosiae]|uniref:Uncharacterized protein n=1 Tax=Paraburkholderia rhynchosiae TaxID=487049 RepID=A0ABX4V125_9BURK|nr:hypothetical protein C0Z16_22315 [Paraburkholderia rhynchosiae]
MAMVAGGMSWTIATPTVVLQYWSHLPSLRVAQIEGPTLRCHVFQLSRVGEVEIMATALHEATLSILREDVQRCGGFLLCRQSISRNRPGAYLTSLCLAYCELLEHGFTGTEPSIWTSAFAQHLQAIGSVCPGRCNRRAQFANGSFDSIVRIGCAIRNATEHQSSRCFRR